MVNVLNLTRKQTLIIFVVATALTLLIVGAAASYLMVAPASDPVTVLSPTPSPSPSPSPTPLPASMSKVQVAPTTLYLGNTVTLSTTVNDASAGIVVNFYNNLDAAVGSTTTSATGLASITITPPQGVWTYYATAQHP
jgi:hypothetical protein